MRETPSGNGRASGRWQPQGPVLLTGCTGAIGMQLLARYLQRTERQVYALVRAADQAQATARVAAAVATMLPDAERYADRVLAVPADLAHPDLGLSAHQRDALAESVNEIVHVAASVSFVLELDQSRAINVEGTRRMLELGDRCQQRGGLRRFSYVSTSYVAGRRRGSFAEADLDLGQRFRNHYERSKFEAETLVRASMARLPIQVFRPSIVVGERETGWTPAFNVIYGPMRAFARGAYAAVPARLASPVDIVPIDYVADAIFELSGHSSGIGETYQLAAGPQASTVRELIELSAGYFGRRRPIAITPALYRRAVHPWLLRSGSHARRAALKGSEPYFPYFAMRVRYDTTNTAGRLDPLGLHVPPVGEYFGRLAEYAVTARWGKAALTRPELVARQREDERTPAPV